MKTKFLKINIFIFLTAIFLLGTFVLPSAAKAWTINWHYPQFNHSSVNITTSAQDISTGSYVTLSWTSKNISACTKTGDWYGSAQANGSETVLVNKNSKYEITCANNGGGASYDFVWVYTNRPSSPSYAYPSYNDYSSSNSSDSNYMATYYSSSLSGQSFSNRAHNSGIRTPNLTLEVKSRDVISSSSFAKEISSRPGRALDLKVNINNNSANKLGYLFVALPSRLAYVNGSAYLDGVKLNISSISSIDLNYLSASSHHILTFQASVAPYNSFSENTTVLRANVSVKSSDSSAYIASDYTNVIVYKNGNDSEGIVLGASTVNTGTGAPKTILISTFAGLLAVLSYLLIKSYRSAKEMDPTSKTSILEKDCSLTQKIRNLANKTVVKTLEICDF